MIVTLTANPSLDRAISLESTLVHGEVQSARSIREDAGGKGINVARVVAAAGEKSLAVLPLADADPFGAALAATGIAKVPVAMLGNARSNLTVLDPDGTTTKINLPGPLRTAAEISALIDATVVAAERALWLVLAGSVPPGAGEDFYLRVIEATRARWGSDAPRIAVDASGDVLARIAEAGTPDLIKPNDIELAQLTGAHIDVEDVSGIAEIARTLVPSKVGSALVTLGAAGALLVTADGSWFGIAPRIVPVSTVGAGDSSLAGYLLADVAGAGPEERLRHAMRYGAAAASLPGTQAPTPDDLGTAEIVVHSLSL